MSALDQAIAFAAIAHADQTRKYTGEPYVLHPIEVMMLVRTHAQMWDEHMLIAAVLHDVVEDTEVTYEDVFKNFGEDVAVLVHALTDQFCDHSLGNRRQRKDMERQRLADIPARAATIKLADLVSNTCSIAEHDQDFARVYLREKEAVLLVLEHGDPALHKLASDGLIQAKLQLMQCS